MFDIGKRLLRRRQAIGDFAPPILVGTITPPLPRLRESYIRQLAIHESQLLKSLAAGRTRSQMRVRIRPVHGFGKPAIRLEKPRQFRASYMSAWLCFQD
jgi:hypothetical protein